MSSLTSVDVELTDAESNEIWNAAKAAGLKKSSKNNGPKDTSTDISTKSLRKRFGGYKDTTCKKDKKS